MTSNLSRKIAARIKENDRLIRAISISGIWTTEFLRESAPIRAQIQADVDILYAHGYTREGHKITELGDSK